MLSKRKEKRNNWKYVSVLAYYNEAVRMTYKGVKLTGSEIAFLAACLLENIRTNEMTQLKRIKSIIGVSLNPDRSIGKLLTLGLLLRPVWGCFVVSNEGEYFLRDLESMFSRIVDNKPFSKWRKIISQDDPRLAYVRRPRVKGAKIVDKVKKQYVKKSERGDPSAHVMAGPIVWDKWGNVRPVSSGE